MANPNPKTEQIEKTQFKNLTKEQRRQIARKGAEATNKLLKERKTMKEQLLILLAQNDNNENINISLINRALSGDVKAYEVIRDTIGEKPIEKVEGNVNSQTKIVYIEKDEIDNTKKHIEKFID